MPRLDLARRIFEEPPDDMEDRAGALLVNWAGSSGRETIEMARAYRVAAERLLHAAGKAGESWEAIDPVLFCYRHAIELFLKALFPGSAKNHGLESLGAALSERFRGRYPADQIAWLHARINEIQALDPKSTAFRYADSCHGGADPEIWVEFQNLHDVTIAIFCALERIYVDDNALRHLSESDGAP